MAIYRTIQISYWQDKFILSLTPEQKYFYIYLMTNSKTKQCGCYELPANIISFETGYNLETVKKLLDFFSEKDKIRYDDSNEEILLLNWFKYNPVGNVNVLKCIIKELDVVKCSEFYFMICEKLESGILSENLIKMIQITSRYQADYKQIVRNKHNINTNTKHQHNNKHQQKQLSAEKAPPICKPDFIEEIIRVFRNLYLNHKKDEYISVGGKGLSAGKDRKAVGQLLQVFKLHYPNENSEQIMSHFISLFDICFSITDPWLSKNMTLSIINSKLNEIIQYAKNERDNGFQSKQERIRRESEALERLILNVTT